MTRSFGRYEIEESLGEGGMGIVYAARDPELARRVAVKLLRPDGDDLATRRDRLLKEAQAMARLAHPNVIAVHDVGTEGGEVFVAMELVDGGTLKQWLRAEKHPWREVLARFQAAGAGLAAAHDAGLVHRDFKPDNVLLRKDGAVLVTDFGLARPTATGAAPGSPEATPTSIGGTPAYMAPEQHRGDLVDARADQFAFCVSLHEGLYGERPFSVDDRATGVSPADALALEVLQGRVRPPPPGTDVPAWIAAVIRRGLAVDPADRWPSMHALLDALAQDPVAARRRLLARAGIVAVGLAAIAAAVLAIVWRRAATSAPKPCAGFDRRVARIWSPTARVSVTNIPDRGAAFAGQLDSYARSWVTVRTDVCEATAVRKEQSPEALDVRMACLDGELRALGTTLEGLPAARPDLAASAILLLEDPASCARAGGAARPKDPRLRQVADELADDVARARALDRLGRTREARDLLAADESRASSAQYPPIEAELLLLLGQLDGDVGDRAKMRDLMTRGIAAAEAGHDDKDRAFGLIQLLWLAGEESHFDEAHAYGRLAESPIKALGGEPDLEAVLLGDEAIVYLHEGKDDDSIRLARAQVDLRTRTNGPDDYKTGLALANLQASLSAGKQLDESTDAGNRAAKILEATSGHDTPAMARVVAEQALTLERKGDPKDALDPLVETYAIHQRLEGPDSEETGIAAENVGEILNELERFDEAMPYLEDALRVYEKESGPSSRDVIGPLELLAEAELGLDKEADAIPFLEREIPVLQANPSSKWSLPEAQVELGACLFDTGADRVRGRELVVDALAVLIAKKDEHGAAIARDWLAAH